MEIGPHPPGSKEKRKNKRKKIKKNECKCQIVDSNAKNEIQQQLHLAKQISDDTIFIWIGLIAIDSPITQYTIIT